MKNVFIMHWCIRSFCSHARGENVVQALKFNEIKYLRISDIRGRRCASLFRL